MAIILPKMSKKQIARLEAGDMTVFSEPQNGRSKDAHEVPFDSADWLADTFKVVLGIVPMMEKEWRSAGCPDDIPVREFHFHRKPKSPGPRIDFCYPYQHLAIECDGGTRMGGDGSRPVGGSHNSDRDRDRNNLLAILGWRRISFTPAKIEREPHDVLRQIMEARFPKTKDYSLPDGH